MPESLLLLPPCFASLAGLLGGRHFACRPVFAPLEAFPLCCDVTLSAGVIPRFDRTSGVRTLPPVLPENAERLQERR